MACLCIVATIASMAIPLLQRRLALVAGDENIGHADSAAYAIQARSLASGRGLTVPYVTNFFRRYDPEIWRHEDHWPPFLAFLLAPVFRFTGPSASAAHAVTVCIGALLLPLAAAWLAMAATGRGWTAVIAAALCLVPLAVFQQSVKILCDIPLGVLLAAYAAAMLSSRRHPSMFLWAGLLGAMAYYAKGSQLILLPLMPALAFILHGPKILRSRWLAAGCALFLALLLPWLIANTRRYGNPLHSTQNYVSSFFGLPQRSWDANFYRVYWDHALPETTDRFTDRGAFQSATRRNLEQYARSFVLGPDSGPREWPRIGYVGVILQHWFLSPERPLPPAGDTPWVRHPREWPAWPMTVAHLSGMLWGAIALVLWLPVAIGTWIWRRARATAPPGVPARGPAREYLDATAVIALLLTIEAAFVILLWEAQTRFTLSLLPLAAALGMLLLGVLVAPLHWAAARLAGRCIKSERIRTAGKEIRWLGVAVLCLVAAIAWGARVDDIADWQEAKSRMRRYAQPQYPRYAHLAWQISRMLPDDAILMSRNPWELLFYCPETMRGVGLPFAEPAVIFAIAKYYGVTHFIWDKNRPGLSEFLRGGHPALTLVIEGRTPVYAIDYTKFADGELADMDAYRPVE